LQTFLNSTDKTEDESEAIDIVVKKSHSHPDFRQKIRYHDIGLLELIKTITFADDLPTVVNGACLHTRNVANSNNPNFIIAGWGRNEREDSK